MNKQSLLAIFICAFLLACTPLPPASKVDLTVIIKEGSVIPANGISSTGQPNAAAFKVFANSGYKTVIDLRGIKEKRGLNEPAVLSSLGLKYIQLPIENADAISFDNAAKLDQLIGEADGPILLHCGSGNRVGALLTLRESLHGKSDSYALTVGKNAGLTGLKPVVVDILRAN